MREGGISEGRMSTEEAGRRPTGPGPRRGDQEGKVGDPGEAQERGRSARTVGLPLQVVLLHAVDGELVRRVGGGQRRRHQQQHGWQEDDEAERQARRLQHVLQDLACFLQHPGWQQGRTRRRRGRDSGVGFRGLTSAWVAGGVLRTPRRTAQARSGVLRALLRPTHARRGAS